MTADPKGGVQGVWMPIETAPRDGSWFLICRDEDGPESYEVGAYEPMRHGRFEPAGDGLYRRVEAVVYEWTGFNNMHRATHWTPLPEPPAAIPQRDGRGREGGEDG